MLIVTTDGLAGYVIRNVLGDVLGTSVHADHGSGAHGHAPAGNAPANHGPANHGPNSLTQQPAAPSSASFRVAGDGLAGARRAAVDRLAEDAHRKGANAVVGMCFETVALAGGGHEVCAYGTAVWAEPQHGAPPQQPPQQRQNSPYPHQQTSPYGEPQPGGPPMAARNLTIGLHDQPR
ncbi:YbjQ family protein [Actinomadura atramentaria]|uniref:YbjQ family protein n=1 Tax=Actinomadura atramentaria TaxID=1990 RepID=UPI00037C1095|nr:heavy metal-binding domain-containing protein [Actinomadura atramentaria]